MENLNPDALKESDLSDIKQAALFQFVQSSKLLNDTSLFTTYCFVCAFVGFLNSKGYEIKKKEVRDGE